MHLLLLALLAADSGRMIEVRFAGTPPRIDGRLEAVWQTADSASGFIQANPSEGAEPTEPTVVYVLQDPENLYVAFRFHCRKAPPLGQLYGVEDEATLFLDPMDSRSMGYFFKVYGSGLYRSGLILDNGASQDWSWEGVWNSAVQLHPDRMEVEMQIPFKSIRYKHGASEWGINFHRMIAREREDDYWTSVKVREGGNQVSGYGRLEGIRPQAQGYYFELYPEAFLRYDQDATDTVSGAGDVAEHTKPRASLNLKWDITSQSTLNATVLPDFAQIESDPYYFNLSRYPVLLSELRPFFTEGSELFRMSAIGMGPFSPLRIFYSRRIGGAEVQPGVLEPVPIISGIKYTTRSNDWSFGALGAYTDLLKDDTGALLEPERGFAVLSGRGRIPGGQSLGALFCGTLADENDYNYAMGFDWGYTHGPNRAVAQTAISDRTGKQGWALNSGYAGFIGSFITTASMQVISDSFSVEDIGYVPWAGQNSFNINSGPFIQRQGNGGLRQLVIAPGLYAWQEPGNPNLSGGASLYASPTWRNCGGELNASVGRTFEADTNYLGRDANLSFWCRTIRYDLSAGASYAHGFNYLRWFVADRYSGWVVLNYYLFGRVALSLFASNNWEANPEGRIVGVTSPVRPKIDFRVNSRMAFNVYSEMVFITPELEFSKTELRSNRIGCLFSWNFRPKSWLYVALNDYSRDNTRFGDDVRDLDLVSRVAAVKVRYLFYF